jgi:putative redox protein
LNRPIPIPAAAHIFNLEAIRMDMDIFFAGGKKVNASYLNFTVATDQSRKEDGDESAPTPFSLFFASLGTCAGSYVLEFCRERNIPTENIRLTLRTVADRKKKMIRLVEIKIIVPPDFPDKYRQAVIRAADLCSVKKHILDPPLIETTIQAGGP